MKNHLLFFHALLAIPLLHSAAPNLVFDSDGDVLTTETSYFVLPAGRECKGGGLMPSPHGLSCPLFVAQDGREGHSGLPVQFTLRGASPDQAIRTSSDVRIHFTDTTACAQSTEWHLDRVEPVLGYRHVLIGPTIFNSEVNVFRVEEHGGMTGEYKLVSCGDTVCKDLSMFEERGKRWLGLSESDSVLVVIFEKA